MMTCILEAHTGSKGDGKGHPSSPVKMGGFLCLGQVLMGAGSGGGCSDREPERDGRTLEA